MRIINKDMTRESIRICVTAHQIHAEIFTKVHGKWKHEQYFQSYDWKPDEENVELTIKHIKRTWGLSDPKVIIE